MTDFPLTIDNEAILEELLSRPTEAVTDMLSRIDGEIMFLGIAGKIGPSLATMVKRACRKAGVTKRIYGVSRFSKPHQKKQLEAEGIKIIQGDLLDAQFISSLPEAKNVFFLAGMKFGSEDNLAMTWAVNSYLPAMVAEKFRESRIVAYSTGCVYPLVNISSGGSVESDKPDPEGEYAQSCLGRERMFEYASQKYGTPVVLIRLNYAVEMRYGVPVDIGLKVFHEQLVDLSMGYFNAIWQGDSNAMVIRSLEHCAAPAKILNITGADTLSVREVALEFGSIFDKKVRFKGTEADTALLSNAGAAHGLFGKPEIDTERMIRWIAGWIEKGNRMLNKPTHFEVRDGKY